MWQDRVGKSAFDVFKRRLCCLERTVEDHEVSILEIELCQQAA